MRYWVYQDSRILGPFDKEELRSVEGLHEASLVCTQGQSGTQEMDWVALESVEDLSSVFGASAEVAQQTASAAGSFDQFSNEAHASVDNIGASENWMESIQKDPRLSDLWGGMPEGVGPEKNWELHQGSDLDSRLTEMQAKLDANERRQNEILDRLGEKDRELVEKNKMIADLRAKLGGGGAETFEATTSPSVPEAVAPSVSEAATPPAPEIVPFGDDLEVPEQVSRHEPVESGDAVSDAPLAEPPAGDIDAPLILDEPEMPNIVETPEPEAEESAPISEEASAFPTFDDAPALDAAPGVEETVAPALDAAPALEEGVGGALDAVPGLDAFPTMDEPVAQAPAVDEFGIPEATPLKSVSEMPSVEEFTPPTPDETGDIGVGVALGAAGVALGAAAALGAQEAPPLDAPPLDAPPLDAPPLDAPPLDAPPLDAPPLDAPPLDASPLDAPPLGAPSLDAPPLEEGGDLPPMPAFGDAPALDEGAPPLEPPPLEDALGPAVGGDAPTLTMPSSTPETIDLSAPVGMAVSAEDTVPPAGDDPFAAPKTMMMGGAPTPAPADGADPGAGFNLTPPPMPVASDAGGDLVGGMPPGMEGPPGSTPMPIALGEGEAPMGTPPPTPMPSMGQPDLPQTVMQGLGVSGMPTPMPTQNPTPAPASGFQDMMGGQGAPTPLPSIPGAQTPQAGAPPTMAPVAATPMPMATQPGDAPLAAPPGAGAPKQSTADKLKAKMGKLGGKKFLIGLVVAVLVLAGLLFMFLRNPKDVVKMAEMGPEQKTRGSFDVDSTDMGPGGVPGGGKSSPLDQPPQETQMAQQAPSQGIPQRPQQTALQPAPQQQPQAAPPQAPPPQQAAPTPPPAAPKRRAFIQDQRIEAIEFVKGYRISGGKEVVAQRLQYYFLGGDNLPEWQAGALEKNKWIVEYHVFKGRGGGKRKKPTVTYRFEVDLAGKNVKGLNARARTLLGSSGSRKRASSRRRSSSSRQAPLPSEDQLDGSRKGRTTGFNNPGE